MKFDPKAFKDRVRNLGTMKSLKMPTALVLLALVDLADDGGWCQVSIPELARWNPFGVTSVRNALNELEGVGLLDRCLEKPGLTNKYRIHYEW